MSTNQEFDKNAKNKCIGLKHRMLLMLLGIVDRDFKNRVFCGEGVVVRIRYQEREREKGVDVGDLLACGFCK